MQHGSNLNTLGDVLRKQVVTFEVRQITTLKNIYNALLFRVTFHSKPKTSQKQNYSN